MLDTKFRIHRITLGVVLLLITLAPIHFILKIVLWLLGTSFIASGLLKSCPIREQIKKHYLKE
jgi:phosphoglycerol transferase MdoB-like AlkP superfamily enzyme